ncbi:hypothetical protein D1164_00885 [Mariniphaga sediminis]|uniref:Uncharacterized protein n=1 Tax=Mariniphaga sediminis TaxID=1628158 RepID=A0A399D9M8_9BACT|nr:hypothetical protein D1164_00885 [Mariniphaga sediminis]
MLKSDSGRSRTVLHCSIVYKHSNPPGKKTEKSPRFKFLKLETKREEGIKNISLKGNNKNSTFGWLTYKLIVS